MSSRCFGLVVVGALVASLASQAARREVLPNLVTNPSFDLPVADTSLPEGATVFSVPAAGYRPGVADGGRTGPKALLIEGAGEYGGVVLARLPLDRSREYALRGWVRLEGDPAATASLKFDFFRDNGEWVGSAIPKVVTPATTGWQRIALVDRADEFRDATQVGAVAVLTGQGKAWFDDIEWVARTPTAVPRNRLPNGNLEQVNGTVPAAWERIVKPDSATVTFEASEENPRDGWFALHLKGKVDYALGLSDPVAIRPGKTYVLTGFGRLTQGQASLKIDYYAGAAYLGSTESSPLTGGDWEEQRVRFEGAKFPKATHLRAAAVIEGNSEAWFDRLVLTEDLSPR